MVTHTFPLMEVSGDAYTMGRRHGEQAAVLVHRYLAWIDRLTRTSRDRLCANAMRLLPYIEALSPRFIEEIRGLADGAGISFEEAVLCQARAEASHTHDGGCSAFALTGEATADGLPLAGQNQDLDPEYADVAILLRVTPDDGRPPALMFTFAGQLGYAGMNAHGVAHFANALPDSCPRLDRLRALIREAWGAITVDTMKTILADHEGDPGGICRHGEQRMHSISGYIAEPAQRLLHVHRGHGCLGSWETYEV